MTDFFDTTTSACRGYPTEWWFPAQDSNGAKNARSAIKICGACDVKEPCLIYSLRNETHGIWGGLRETDRELERRRRNISLTDEALASISQSTRRIYTRLNQLDSENKEYL